MSPRPDVSNERKNQIINASISVFSRLGFHEARMDDIVQESGLSKGTLYWYFKGKDEIITAILSNIFEKELVLLSNLSKAEGTAAERLMEFTRLAVADFNRLLKIRPIVYEFYAIAFRQNNVRTALRHYFRNFMEMLVPIFQQGIERGELRNLNAIDAAIGASAIIEGTFLLWVYDPDRIDIKKHVTSSMKIFLDGLKPD